MSFLLLNPFQHNNSQSRQWTQGNKQDSHGLMFGNYSHRCTALELHLHKAKVAPIWSNPTVELAGSFIDRGECISGFPTRSELGSIVGKNSINPNKCQFFSSLYARCNHILSVKKRGYRTVYFFVTQGPSALAAL